MRGSMDVRGALSTMAEIAALREQVADMRLVMTDMSQEGGAAAEIAAMAIVRGEGLSAEYSPTKPRSLRWRVFRPQQAGGRGRTLAEALQAYESETERHGQIL